MRTLTLLLIICGATFSQGLVMKPDSLWTTIILGQSVSPTTTGFLVNTSSTAIAIDSIEVLSISNGIKADSLRAFGIYLYAGENCVGERHINQSNGDMLPQTLVPTTTVAIIPPLDSLVIKTVIFTAFYVDYWYMMYDRTNYYSSDLVHFWVETKIHYDGTNSLIVWLGGEAADSSARTTPIQSKKPIPSITNTPQTTTYYNIRGQVVPYQAGVTNQAAQGVLLQRNSTATTKMKMGK